MVPIFLFLNTLVIGVVIFYVIGSYLIPSITDDMNEGIAFADKLKEDHRELLREYESLKIRIKNDDAVNEVIQSKVIIWAKMVHADQQQKQQLYVVQTQELSVRARKKAEMCLFSKVQKEVSAKGLIQAERELTALFANTQRGQVYVQSLVGKIQKGLS